MPALPTGVLINFTYTTPTGSDGNTYYVLYLDQNYVANQKGNSTTFFQQRLAVGEHTYEIRAYTNVSGFSSTAGPGASGISSKAASGNFTVNFNTRNLIVGTSNLGDAIDFVIEAILDLIGSPADTASYTISFEAAMAMTVNQFTNMGAASSSENYKNGQYAPFNVNSGPITYNENYPLGSQVHLEMYPQSGSGQVLTLDFTAGGLNAPSPTELALPQPMVLNLFTFTTGEGGNPYMSISNEGSLSPVPTLTYIIGSLTDVNNQLILTIPQGNDPIYGYYPTGADLNYWNSLTNGSQIPWYSLDPVTQAISGTGVTTYSDDRN